MGKPLNFLFCTSLLSTFNQESQPGLLPPSCHSRLLLVSHSSSLAPIPTWRTQSSPLTTMTNSQADLSARHLPARAAPLHSEVKALLNAGSLYIRSTCTHARTHTDGHTDTQVTPAHFPHLVRAAHTEASAMSLKTVNIK